MAASQPPIAPLNRDVINTQLHKPTTESDHIRTDLSVPLSRQDNPTPIIKPQTKHQAIATATSIRPSDKPTAKANTQDTNTTIPSPRDEPLATLNALLKRGKYRNAVNHFAAQYATLDADLVFEYHTSILNFAANLSARRNYDDAVQLLSILNVTFPGEISTLLQLADIQHSAKNFSQEIEALLAAASSAYKPTDIQIIEERIRNAAALHTSNHVERYKYYQTILTQQPNLAAVELAYAKTLLDLWDTTAARHVITKYEWDWRYRKEMKTLKDALHTIEAKANMQADNMVSIPLQSTNIGHVVGININGQPSKLLIDHGVTISSLYASALTKSNLDTSKANKRQINTVNGITHPYILTIPEAYIGPIELSNLQVRLLQSEQPNDIDGVLGKDFLQNYTFAINTEHNELRLIE